MREQVANQINKSLERAGHQVRVDHRTLEAQRAEALEKGDHEKAEELNRAPERHLGPKLANQTAREVRELADQHKDPYDVFAKRERQEQFQKLEAWRKDLHSRESSNYLSETN